MPGVSNLLQYGVFGRRAPTQGVDDLLGVPLTVGAKRPAPASSSPDAFPTPAGSAGPPVASSSSLAAPLQIPAEIPPAWLAAGAAGLVLFILAMRR